MEFPLPSVYVNIDVIIATVLLHLSGLIKTGFKVIITTTTTTTIIIIIIIIIKVITINSIIIIFL